MRVHICPRRCKSVHWRAHDLGGRWLTARYLVTVLRRLSGIGLVREPYSPLRLAATAAIMRLSPIPRPSHAHTPSLRHASSKATSSAISASSAACAWASFEHLGRVGRTTPISHSTRQFSMCQDGPPRVILGAL